MIISAAINVNLHAFMQQFVSRARVNGKFKNPPVFCIDGRSGVDYLVVVNRNLNLNLSTLRSAATEDGLLNALLCRAAVGF
jgi:hypothetical protein